MTLDHITEIFKWMTILNVGVFLLTSILTLLFNKFVCGIHAKLFRLDREKVPMVLYGYLGTYRIFILVFNLVPYVSLLILK